MVGFHGGARAFAWSELGRFRLAEDGSGVRLAVDDREGRELGSVDAEWFAAPAGHWSLMSALTFFATEWCSWDS